MHMWRRGGRPEDRSSGRSGGRAGGRRGGRPVGSDWRSGGRAVWRLGNRRGGRAVKASRSSDSSRSTCRTLAGVHAHYKSRSGKRRSKNGQRSSRSTSRRRSRRNGRHTSRRSTSSPARIGAVGRAVRRSDGRAVVGAVGRSPFHGCGPGEARVPSDPRNHLFHGALCAVAPTPVRVHAGSYSCRPAWAPAPNTPSVAIWSPIHRLDHRARSGR